MFPHVSDDYRFWLGALVVALVFGLIWWWNRDAKKWLEENSPEEVFPSALDWLLRDTKEKPAVPLKYSEQEFQEMVAKALDEVPQEFEKEWENVAVTVSTDWATEAEKKKMGVPDDHLVSELTRDLTGRRDFLMRVVPDMSSWSISLRWNCVTVPTKIYWSRKSVARSSTNWHTILGCTTRG